MAHEYILPLAGPDGAAVPTIEVVGGKGASLSRLAGAGLPVPDGFYLTTAAYRRFVDHNDLHKRIRGVLSQVDPALVTAVLFQQALSSPYDLGTNLPTDHPDWGKVHENDINMDDGQSMLRLREGIERFFITDINNPAASSKAQSSLVVMWDISVWPSAPTGGAPSFNHIPGGGNVLYMDGHVKFIKYQEEWPLVSTWVFLMDTLESVVAP